MAKLFDFNTKMEKIIIIITFFLLNVKFPMSDPKYIETGLSFTPQQRVSSECFT